MNSPHLECLKHFFDHLFSTCAILEVQGSFSQEHVPLRRIHFQLGEAVGPQVDHVVPTFDDAVLDRVAQFQYAPLSLGFLADINHPRFGVPHLRQIFWSANYRGEPYLRIFVARETCLEFSGAIVNHYNLVWLFAFTHLVVFQIFLYLNYL